MPTVQWEDWEILKRLQVRDHTTNLLLVFQCKAASCSFKNNRPYNVWSCSYLFCWEASLTWRQATSQIQVFWMPGIKLEYHCRSGGFSLQRCSILHDWAMYSSRWRFQVSAVSTAHCLHASILLVALLPLRLLCLTKASRKLRLPSEIWWKGKADW